MRRRLSGFLVILMLGQFALLVCTSQIALQVLGSERFVGEGGGYSHWNGNTIFYCNFTLSSYSEMFEFASKEVGFEVLLCVDVETGVNLTIEEIGFYLTPSDYIFYRTMDPPTVEVGHLDTSFEFQNLKNVTISGVTSIIAQSVEGRYFDNLSIGMGIQYRIQSKYENTTIAYSRTMISRYILPFKVYSVILRWDIWMMTLISTIAVGVLVLFYNVKYGTVGELGTTQGKELMLIRM